MEIVLLQFSKLLCHSLLAMCAGKNNPGIVKANRIAPCRSLHKISGDRSSLFQRLTYITNKRPFTLWTMHIPSTMGIEGWGISSAGCAIFFYFRFSNLSNCIILEIAQGIRPKKEGLKRNFFDIQLFYFLVISSIWPNQLRSVDKMKLSYFLWF